MANIKDFIKKIGNEAVSLEEQQQALVEVEKTIVEAKAKREESIGKNVDLVISALKTIESKLETKLDELNNTPAKQGVVGPQGPAGKEGRDGVDGYKGQDGRDGVDGKDGKDGEDGVSVTDAQIDFDGSLLITLSDGREIDAGTIIPLDVAKQIHSVSTNGGGTSQSVLDSIASLQAQIDALGGGSGGGISSVASADGSVTVTTTSGAVDLSVPVTGSTSNIVCQVRNTTGATLTKGTAVYISGATGQIPTVSKALATSDATSAQTLGLLTANLTNNTNGYVTVIGLITNIDTSSFTDGAQLYLSSTTAGALTATKQFAPAHLVYVAVVEHAHPTQGKLFVKVQNGYEMDELHNVSAQTPSNGNTLIYNNSNQLWEAANITNVGLTTGTISTAPSSTTDIVNKSYADSIASGVNFHAAVNNATTTALPTNTYNNGISGVGATLTAVANGALTVDGTSQTVGNRVLVKDEAITSRNGVYTVTQVGSGVLPYILTRATDYDSSGSGTNEIDAGDMILVLNGTSNANTSWVQQTPLPITVGTTAIVFIEFAKVQTYTAGTGLTLSTNQFSITNTGTAGTYGSATLIPVITTNAQGQVTSVTTASNPQGTVTSVAALTLGTTGTDLSSSVATGTTTPVITLNVPTASATNRGALSSADWTTFNGKGSGTVTSVGFTGGIISVGTATTTPAFTVAGTSGGIPYFSSASTWATSAALAANALVIGGGAGVAPATTTTGTGVITALGVNTGTTGAFVVNGGALGTPSGGTVTNLTGTASININGTVGGTTPASGSFTSLTATSVGTGGVLAKTGGKTAVTAIATTTTLTTGGTTLASQVMATGSVWRVTAYGTVVAPSSATVRTLTMACFWGATQLTAITTGSVLASTAQTTPWKVEFEITGSSATAAWITGFLSAQVTSATIPLNYVATAASTTGLTTTSTLDFRIANGTAAIDAFNVQQVVIERIV